MTDAPAEMPEVPSELLAAFKKWMRENPERVAVLAELSARHKQLYLCFADFLVHRSVSQRNQIFLLVSELLQNPAFKPSDEHLRRFNKTLCELNASVAVEARDVNLFAGRLAGAKRQKEVSARNKELLVSVYLDLIRSPDWSRRGLSDIVAYLTAYAESQNLRQVNGKPYAAGTIRNWIKGKA